VLGGFWAGLAIQPSGSHQIQHSVAFLVFGLLLAYCCFLAAAYSMSNSSPERALITPAYFLANGILIGSFFVGQEFYTKFSRYPIVKTGIVGLLFLLMFISSSLNVSVLYSMRPAYVQYAHQWDEMDAYIRAEKIKGRTKVRILAKQNWVGLDEPKNKPHFWLNVCMSDYYGIQVLAPASDQP
jgi:hypothetical protein